MIRQDAISAAFIVYAALAVTFLATYSTTTVVMFPFILLIGGLALEYRFSKRIGETPEDSFKRVPYTQIGLYAGLALVVMLVTGLTVQYIPLAEIGSMPVWTDAFLYTTSIAVAEEIFFRGFITDALLSYNFGRGLLNNNYFKLFLSGGVFAVYHLARYGTSVSNMIYVAVCGFVLSWVAWKTRRLSPSIIAHVFNNIFALGVF